MNNKYTFLDAAEEVLNILGRPESPNFLWGEIKKLGLDKKIGSNGKTPWATLNSQLLTDVNKKNSRFVADKTNKPIVYFLKSKTSVVQSQNLIGNTSTLNCKKYNYLERDLHSFLVKFAFDKLNTTYSKTIFHEKSSKKAFNEWIHPDLVGFSFSFKSYSEEVLKFTNNGFDLIKFYSFEMKRELDLSNLRESFFQAVSNSSWAHEGYLVAANIKDDISLKLELERLSNSFGIGIIELILDEPEKTKILFPSKTKNRIDWDAVDKLIQENPDFKNFMNDVRIDVSNNKLHKENYDTIKSIDELKKIYQGFK